MQTYKRRIKEEIICKHLTAFPAVALLGARQVGKSTLAKKIIEVILMKISAQANYYWLGL